MTIFKIRVNIVTTLMLTKSVTKRSITVQITEDMIWQSKLWKLSFCINISDLSQTEMDKGKFFILGSEFHW